MTGGRPLPCRATGFDPDELAYLQAERDQLLRSLADLDDELASGELSHDDYRQLHDDYTARAAATLRRVEALGSQRRSPPRPRRRRFVIGVGLFAVSAAIAAALVAGLGQRRGGQTLSGNGQVTTADRRVLYAHEVAARPSDPAPHLDYARYLLDQGDLVAALKQFDVTSHLDPGNAEALAYGGWLAFLGGFPDPALGRLDKAVAAQPDYPDAHAFRGIVLLRARDDRPGAIAELNRYLALAPTSPLADQVRSVLAQLAVPAPRDRTAP